MLVVIIATVLISFCLLVLNYLQKSNRLPVSQTRRLAHILSGVYSLVIYPAVEKKWFLIVCAGFAIIMIISRSKNFFTCVHAIDRQTYGENLFSVSMFLTALLAGDETTIFMIATLILTFADVAAGWSGDLLKSKKKTVVGSGAFFLVSTTILLIFQVPIGLSVILSLLLTVVEYLSKWGLDNLLIPVVATLVLRIFGV